MRILPLAILLFAQERPKLEEVKSFAYWLQKIDLKELGASKFGLCIIDHANDGKEFTREEIAALRAGPGGPKIVLAYLSIGEAENYRPYWKKEWSKTPPEWLGPENPDWPGNFEVRYWMVDWQKIVTAYLDTILAQGFDGAYFDIVDGFEFWDEKEPDSKPRARMVEFVSSLSKHAKASRKEFLIFGQNAEALVEEKAYLAAIDGIGREETWYLKGKKNAEREIQATEAHLDKALKAGKKVLTVEYLKDAESIDWVYARAASKGYLATVTRRALDRLVIPKGHEPH